VRFRASRRIIGEGCQPIARRLRTTCDLCTAIDICYREVDRRTIRDDISVLIEHAGIDRVVFVLVEHEKSGKNRLHWDFAPHTSDDRDAEINRLVDLTAAHLDTQLHRGPVQAKTVLALDACGPRTSPWRG
jgi:hypothetical protein